MEMIDVEDFVDSCDFLKLKLASTFGTQLPESVISN